MKKTMKRSTYIILGTAALLSSLIMQCSVFSADSSMSKTDADKTLFVFENVPVSFHISSDQFYTVSLDDLENGNSEIQKELQILELYDDGYLFIPADKTVNNADYYISIYENKDIAGDLTGSSLLKSLNKGFEHFDYMDASESTLENVYKGAAMFGAMGLDEKYYDTDAARFFILKNSSGQEGSCRLQTGIDGHTISISCYLLNPAAKETAVSAVYQIADGMTRGDDSGTLAASIRTNGVSKDHEHVAYVQEMPAMFLYDEDNYNVLTTYYLKEDSISINRLGISYEKACDFMGDGTCLLVTPAEDTFDDARIVLLIDSYSGVSDTGNYLRIGAANENGLRELVDQCVTVDLDLEYITPNGQIYLGYEEPYDGDEETGGLFYYFSIWDGTLICIQCQYDMEDADQNHEAAEELFKSTVNSFYDYKVAINLPDCLNFSFGFTNILDGSDIIPIEYGRFYGMDDHEVISKDITASSTGDYDNYHHSYEYCKIEENESIENTVKLLGITTTNAIYQNSIGYMYAYDERPMDAARTGGMSEIITAWSMDASGEWRHMKAQEEADLFSGKHSLQDCESVFTIVVDMDKEGKTNALMLTYASYEDTLKFITG